MAYYREQQIDEAFFALSHPVRRGVLAQLAEKDLSVAEVSKPFSESPSVMTKHLHVLERSGLLSRRKEGRVHYLHFEPEPMREMADWIMHYKSFWSGKFDALNDYLHSLNPNEKD